MVRLKDKEKVLPIVTPSPPVFTIKFHLKASYSQLFNSILRAPFFSCYRGNKNVHYLAYQAAIKKS